MIYLGVLLLLFLLLLFLLLLLLLGGLRGNEVTTWILVSGQLRSLPEAPVEISESRQTDSLQHSSVEQTLVNYWACPVHVTTEHAQYMLLLSMPSTCYYSGFQVGCHKIFHTCAINPFKIDDLNGSPEHALTFFVTTNLKTAVLSMPSTYYY